MTSSGEPPLLLVIGSVNYDFVLTHDRLPRAGESLIGADLVESPGGKGANQAVAAARFARGRWPLRIAFGGAIGRDERGAVQRRALEREGIDTRGLVVFDDLPTGTSSVWVDRRGGENRILSATGANTAYAPEHLDRLPFDRASLVLVANEIPAATVGAVGERAAGSGVPVVWNPAPFPVGSVSPLARRQVAIVTPNAVEAAALLGRDQLDRPASAARELVAAGWSTAVVTLGPRGAVWATANGSGAVSAPAVEAVDTTGAGDAFNGALAACLAAGRAFEEAIGEAVLYASDSVRRPGTQTAYGTGRPSS